MDLNLVHLCFSLTIDGFARDRFALFALRRSFPSALKRATCGRLLLCGECRDSLACPWFPLFGQPLSSDPEAVRRHQKPPLPFIFDLPLLPEGAHHCRDLEVGLTLVGSATASAGAFVAAMRELSAADLGDGSFTLSLDGVVSRGLFGERLPLEFARQSGAPKNLQLLPLSDVASGGGGGGERLTLSLVTPLRLFHEGKGLRSFDCSLFLRGVVRRVSSLVAAYGDGEMADDFRWLAHQSREVRVTESRIRFDLSGGMTAAGMMGEALLEGELEPFLPYLRLGEYLHAGKGGSWGFGRFQLR